MAKSSCKLFLYSIISVLLLFGLIRIFSTTSGRFFQLELLGMLFLTFLTLLGLIGYSRWGEKLLFFVFTLYLANLALIWYVWGSFHLVLVLIALIGFLMSMPKKCYCCREETSDPDFNVNEAVKEEIPEIAEEKKEVTKTVATHSPGKYVASQQSNVYHEPKCNWAKKIKKSRRVWFADKKEAQTKGYRAHACAK